MAHFMVRMIVICGVFLALFVVWLLLILLCLFPVTTHGHVLFSGAYQH
jgi:hypothetical protein